MVNLLTIAFLQQDTTSAPISAGAAAGMGIGMTIFMLVIALVMVAAMWKVFVKAGEPGWAAIVPIYNLFVLLKIAGKPAWWIILFLVPFVNFVMFIVVGIAVAKVFGKGTGFGLGLAFLGLIFYPVLAWGDARYQGPQAS
jgi:hypothetical protein